VRYRMEALGRDRAEEACALLQSTYAEERKASPLLPLPLLGGEDTVLARISDCIGKGCVAAFDDKGMAGYMGLGAAFPFKGQTAALVSEWAHAGRPGEAAGLYRALYAGLGELLAGKGMRLHIVAHFTHDRALGKTLFDLGFGTFLMEELRDLSPIPGAARNGIAMERDLHGLEELDAEHARYYQGSPIFLMKDSSPEAVRTYLDRQEKSGNAVFVYREAGRPEGYFIVGPRAGNDVGSLLEGSNTALMLTAYCRPGARGRNVGKGLLDACVQWAREHGYERLFVEHESANILGSRFWGRHFRPYLRFSMRYVEVA
jgi:GNAT superfamily N-acetyltransferase